MVGQQQEKRCSHLEARDRAAKALVRRAAEEASRGALNAPYLLGVEHILERARARGRAGRRSKDYVAAMSIAAMVREFLRGAMSETTSVGVLALMQSREADAGDCVEDLVDIFVSARSATTKGAAEAGEWAEGYLEHNCCGRDVRATEEAERFAARMAQLVDDFTRDSARAVPAKSPRDGGTDGFLIVDGMQPIDAVQVVERCGGLVYFARQAADGSAALYVHMDTTAANAVALAMVDVPGRYVSLGTASVQDYDSSLTSAEELHARMLRNEASDAEEVEYWNRVLGLREEGGSTPAPDDMTGSAPLTVDAVARVMHILQNLFRPGADWEGDVLPSVPADGLGLVAVAAAQDAYRRMGTCGVVAAMFDYLSVHLDGRGCLASDERAKFAASTLRGICEGSVSLSEERDRDELYEACTPREDDSLFASCILFVVRAALSADHDPTDYDWSVLGIANELAARVGKDAALDFAANLHRAGQQPARAA